MRRKSVWLGVGLLALLCLAIAPWGVAAYGGHAFNAVPVQVSSTGASTVKSASSSDAGAWRAPDLGVPLRDNWWQQVPGFDPATKISGALLAAFSTSPNSQQGFMVYLKAQGNTSNSITDWNAKGEYVLNVLQTVRDHTQPALMQAINSEKASGSVSKATGYTIINAVFVHGTLSAATTLARRNDVAFIEEDHQYYAMDDNAVGAPVVQAAPSSPRTIELGVNYVHAPQVWALGYKGDGVVVGSIDTGVQYDHPALVRQYRGNLGGGNFDHNYNWWDARTDAPPHPYPYDGYGHGTHTVGTVLGDDGDPGTNQIGVAPHAKWIAADALPDGSGGNEMITPAEDFMLAPWDLNGQNRRPDLRPNIVTNSWGDNECWNTDSWLVTQAWIDAGIMPSFANGNAGPGVGTVGSPGGYPFLLGVGAVSASSNVIAGFSSRGPSCYGGVIKPDVVAPGVNVRSSLPGSTYGTESGTSMATPHNSGVMALLLSANASLDYTDVMGILTRTAAWSPSWGTRPNNNYGWGAVQADSAVNMALHGPHVSGTVQSASGPAPQNARITAVRQSDNDTYSKRVHDSGTYSLTVLAGTYDVTASAFGFQSQTVTGQQWLTDTSPVLNFTLQPTTTYAVTGRLFQAGTCDPISGTVNIDPPGWLTTTTTAGIYDVNLPAGTYTFTVHAGAAYQPIVQTVNVSGAMNQDFTLGPAHDASYVVDTPAFNWIPGTTQVTFSNAEDGYATVPLPFTFNYYGNSYTSINMSTNGFATFDDSSEAQMWANTDIPNPGPTPAAGDPPYPNNAVYPYWDDLAVAPRASGAGYYGVTGSAPNRIFVLEWRGVSGAGTPITFEVQFEETTNRITFEYQTISAPYGNGYSATEGIENGTGTSGIEFGENWTGIVGDNQAYRFTPGSAPVITPCVVATSTATSTPSATETTVPTETGTGVATETSTRVPSSTPQPGSPTVTSTPCTISFTDVHPTDYFYNDVKCVYCLGAVSGYSDGTFRPFANTTRGQMTKIIVLALRIPLYTPTAGATFNDVPRGSTFFDYVETAAHNQIVSGYSDGSFKPNALVTRGQLSKIDAVAANKMMGWDLLNPTTPTFSDVPRTNPFYTYIETVSCHGVVSGYSDGTFKWGNNAIRAQIAKIVCVTSQDPPAQCLSGTPQVTVTPQQ